MIEFYTYHARGVKLEIGNFSLWKLLVLVVASSSSSHLFRATDLLTGQRIYR